MTSPFRLPETVACKALEVETLLRAAADRGVVLPFASALQGLDVVFVHDDGRVTPTFEPRPLLFEGTFAGWEELQSILGIARRRD